MNPYNIRLEDLSPSDQAYFKSAEYQSLSPSSRIQIARERLKPTPTSEEIEARNQRDDESMRRIHEARIEAEEARIQALQARDAERKRRFIN